jgi:phosphoserine aminotransferase
MARVLNFSAGPSALPEAVLKKAADEMLDWQGTGQSVMEMSHRSKAYESIIKKTEDLFRATLKVPEDYHVLFLQGGASLQFHTIPLNFLTKTKKADYVQTGAWSQKAVEEAQKLGEINIVGSSKDKKWSYLPPLANLNDNADYFYYCYNNTIEGTQFHQVPQAKAPLITDISSGILSQPFDVGRHAVVFAGAQKNLGPAGVTIVMIKKAFTDRIPGGLPAMLDYKTHADNGSMFNTPPCYAIYIVGLVLQHIQDLGGTDVLFAANAEKAKLLYGYLDSSKYFYSPVEKSVRSLMNVPFLTRVADPEAAEAVNKKFVKEAEAAGLVNLAGHRSVGGMRASIYNAITVDGVKKLVDFMKDFEKKNA